MSSEIEKYNHLPPEQQKRMLRISATVKKYPEISQLMTEQNKDVIISKHGNKSLKSVTEANLIKLSEIEKGYGDNSASAFLLPYAIHIQEACGLDEMTDLQAKTIARAMYTELFLINIAELAIFVDRVTMGKYGKFYGKLTPQMITDACVLFRSDRSKAIAELDKEKNGIDEPINSKVDSILRNAPSSCKNIAALREKAKNNTKLKKGLSRLFDNPKDKQNGQ